MKTAELSGAQLDYYVARAEGVPAEDLQIRAIQRSIDYHVVRTVACYPLGDARVFRVAAGVLRYSTDWSQGGPLIEKHLVCVDPGDGSFSAPRRWEAHMADLAPALAAEEVYGETALQAICRAVVRAAFGDEVEEVAVCE